MSLFLTPNRAFGTAVIVLDDEGRSEIHDLQSAYDYRGRNPMLSQDSEFFGLWSRSGFMCGDPDNPMTSMDYTNSSYSGDYERPRLGSGGTKRPYFFRGTCKDVSETPLAGAVVQAFRTSDDQFVGVNATQADGTYEVPTPYPSAQHYLVAYYPSSPDLAGTTVNTLTPSL